LFVSLFKTITSGEEEPNDDERFALISSLKKVSIFYNCHDMSKWNIWEGLLEVSFHNFIKCQCTRYLFVGSKLTM
jgi:hypothetical protein